MSSRSKKRRTAFTLVEVLIVVAILVMLGGLAVVTYSKTLEGTRIRPRPWSARWKCRGVRITAPWAASLGMIRV